MGAAHFRVWRDWRIYPAGERHVAASKTLRKKLAGAALLLTTGVAVSATVNYFADPQPRHNSVSLANYPAPLAIQGPSHSARELVSSGEATMASTRKLMPVGTKSLLKVPAQLTHGDYVWNEDGVRPGKIAIWVDLRRQMISAFRNGHEIGTAVIVYGAADMSSPEGRFRILRKSSDYHSRKYNAPMPHSLFITNDGVALHGSPMSARRASHGCIGLPADFAQKLFRASKVGDTVQITRSEDTLTI